MDKDEYLRKVKLAKSWMDAYYLDDSPLASDAEYDLLIRELKSYELNHEASSLSPTQLVGVVQKNFKKSQHLEKMWSMEDVFSEAEMKAWLKRAKNPSKLYIEPKFDGASLNLYYDEGVLSKAATRGDGKIGEDVSLNAAFIKGVPKQIPYKKPIEIRGEVLMLKEDFKSLNEQRELLKQSLFANPRNAASGSLRQLDTNVTKERKLVFYPWGVGLNSLEFSLHSQVMSFLSSLGFLQNGFLKMGEGLEDIMAAFSELEGLRDSLPMVLDGMVVRLDELAACKNLGFTQKFPRFMAAFKFKAMEATTRLLALHLQVGRSGVVTPVAVMEPVELAGVTVSRASLHNFEEVDRLGLKLGDSICLIRSADVIPKITKVYENRRDGSEKDILPPSNCPVCESLLVKTGPLLFCKNPACLGVKSELFSYFVSKKCLNIEGLAKASLDLLLKNSIIKDPIDIFFLKHEDFEDLPGFKEKKIQNVLKSIEAAKNCKLAAFINSLSIPLIGEVAANSLAQAFGKEWYKKGLEDFLSLDGFGSEMAGELVEFCAKNASLVERFYEILSFKDSFKSSILKDKSFVITGSLSRPREYYKDLILENGGKVLAQVSAKTNFLLYGEKAGSKLLKAKSLGVSLLDEEGLFLLLSTFNGE